MLVPSKAAEYNDAVAINAHNQPKRIMKQTVRGTLAVMVGAVVAIANADTNTLHRTKALCRSYTAGSVSPATNRGYGKRLDGPKSFRVLESIEGVRNRTVRGEHQPWGYRSGIEDLAYQNGMLLYALDGFDGSPAYPKSNGCWGLLLADVGGATLPLVTAGGHVRQRTGCRQVPIPSSLDRRIWRTSENPPPHGFSAT